jgi:hypothetical protein
MNYDPTQQSGPNPGSYYDPNQQPNSGQGPYQEYSTYNPYAEPQIPYEAAYASYGNTYQVPPVTPLPLGDAVEQLPKQWWKVLSRPGAQTFAEEAGKASWDIIWVQLIGYAIISAILSALQNLTNSATLDYLNRLNANSSAGTTALVTRGVTPASIAIGLVGVLIGFFIAQGILFGLAKAFGGQGTFTQQAYVMLLFVVPLGILEGLLGLVPILGGLVSLAGGIYSIVLAVFAIMGVHRLSGGKASAVVLIPVGVLFLLLCGLIFLLVVVFVNAASQVR